MIKWDGHTHTKFCKHSLPAEQELYIRRAVEQGFARYSLTEHPPLPDRWVNNDRLMAELAMPMEELSDYFAYARSMKEKFGGIIDVAVGLELDYLHGNTGFSEALLEPWSGILEDLVVSVHYLPGTGGMRCIDFTPEDFREGLLEYYGSMGRIIDEYYDHVEQAVEWAGTLPGRVRLGHVNLIEKFRLVLPEQDQAQMDRRLKALVLKLAAAGIGLDVNTAGMRVETCGRAYAPEWLLHLCREQDIPCVYGSDSHKPEHVGFGWDWFEAAMEAGRIGD